MPVSRESDLLDQIENLEDGYEGLKYIHKKELNKQIKKFLEVLRSLHDYTFINVTDANKVIYLRDNIEDELKKYDEKLTSSSGRNL